MTTIAPPPSARASAAVLALRLTIVHQRKLLDAGERLPAVFAEYGWRAVDDRLDELIDRLPRDPLPAVRR